MAPPAVLHQFNVGAGDRDRTGMTSLEGWGSAIELHPRSAARGRIVLGAPRAQSLPPGPMAGRVPAGVRRVCGQGDGETGAGSVAYP